MNITNNDTSRKFDRKVSAKYHKRLIFIQYIAKKLRYKDIEYGVNKNNLTLILNKHGQERIIEKRL